MIMVEYPSMLTRKRKSQTSCQPSSSEGSSAVTAEGNRSNTSAGQILKGDTKLPIRLHSRNNINESLLVITAYTHKQDSLHYFIF